MFGGPTPRWFTSVLVVAEAYAWFLHKHGEEAARRFRLLVDNLNGLTVLDTDRDHRDAVWRMLDRMRGTRLTYVDASSLVLLERHDVGTVWATDRHLGLTGAQVLPRS